MLQRTFDLINPMELHSMVQEVKKLPEYETANAILLEVTCGVFPYAQAECVLKMVAEKLPRAKVIGLSMHGNGDFRTISATMRFHFRFFDSSDVSVMLYDFEETAVDDAVSDVRAKLSEIPNLSCAEIYGIGMGVPMSRIVDDVAEGFEDIPFYGAIMAISAMPVAGMTAASTAQEMFASLRDTIMNPENSPLAANGLIASDHTAGYDNMFSIFEPMRQHFERTKELLGENIDEAEERCKQNLSQQANTSFIYYDKPIYRGFCVVAFSGEYLHVYAEKILGWKPIGREFVAHTADLPRPVGDTVVTEFDGRPATEIYKKYLGVERGAYFTDNVCEFPLVTLRNDDILARVPNFNDEEGRLYFLGDIRDGEHVRFTYGIPSEILENTEKASIEMCKFGPEAISLIICGNRTIFLKKDAPIEVDYYRRLLSNLYYGYGASEIYKYHGEGGVLNSTLVAVGMREGVRKLHCETNEVTFAPRSRLTKFVPLSERLLTFLEQMTTELEDAVFEAEQANEAKSSFLSNMSHEIRTPINAILGMDEMILRESDDESIVGYATDIQNAGNNLLGIVNDILDFSKIEAGKMDIIPVEYDIASVLNDLINMIKKRAEDKGLSLILDIDREIPHLLYGDEIRIKQCVTNILTNAVKYTEEGSVTLSVGYKWDVPEDTLAESGEAKKHTNVDAIKLIFSVKDTGIGMKEEDLGKLFSAFERIEEERNRSIEGTGLGMSITQNLLHLMGSRLDVKSTYGEGSTFSFEVSQRVVKWEPIGDYEESLRNALGQREAYRESFHAPDADILVVDDTPMNLTVMQKLLKKTRIKIDTVASGEECLEITKTKAYDVIFLDHRMPKMDGIETLQYMKERAEKNPDLPNRDTPVISLTANAVSGAREQYIEAGFSDYLTKPIDPAKLEALLLEYLPVEKIVPFDDTAEEHEETSAVSECARLPLWLRARADIDLGEGMKRNGTAEDYLDLLKIYAAGISDNADEIETHFRNEDWENYTIRVHALKSSSRMVGITKLGDLAEAMEHAGDKRDLAAIRKYTPVLLMMYRNYAAALAPVLNGEDKPVEISDLEAYDAGITFVHDEDNPSNQDAAPADDRPEIGEPMLQEAIAAMQEVSHSYDLDTMSYIFDGLAAYRLPADREEWYKNMKKAMTAADWDRINGLLGGA